jgi:hypothetical protein
LSPATPEVEAGVFVARPGGLGLSPTFCAAANDASAKGRPGATAH